MNRCMHICMCVHTIVYVYAHIYMHTHIRCTYMSKHVCMHRNISDMWLCLGPDVPSVCLYKPAKFQTQSFQKPVADTLANNNHRT